MTEPSSPSQQAAPLSPEVLDFAPGLLAIQESPPARLPRTVMYVVAALFAILLAWAFWGRLDIIASAEGRLVPQTYVKIVQPSDAGIVQEILVAEGDTVKAGQVLMRMDTQVAHADEASIKTDLTLKSLQLRRVSAELGGAVLVRKADDPDDLYGRVEAQFQDRRQAYRDAMDQQQAALKKAQRDYEAAQETLSKLRQTVPILKAQAEAFTAMGKDGYVPQVTVQDKQRDFLEKSQDLRAQEATVAGLEAAVVQAQKQLGQTTSKYRSDLQNERVETEGQYRKLQQDWIKQEHKTGLLALKAPQAGIVKDLATHTIGTVVSPGTVLLSLVPENEPLVAEVKIKNDDVGFVYLKQKVKVKLAAYPFQKYGMLDGEVIHVGPDASDGQDAGNSNGTAKEQNKDAAAPLSFKALVALKKQALETSTESFKLMPGMQVVAEINQGSRTVMEYLLSPVQKTLAESGRER